MPPSPSPVTLLIAPGSPELHGQVDRALSSLRITNPVVWITTRDELEDALVAEDKAVLFLAESGPSFHGLQWLEGWSRHPARTRVKVVAMAPSKSTAESMVTLGASSILNVPVTASALWDAITHKARFGFALVQGEGEGP